MTPAAATAFLAAGSLAMRTPAGQARDRTKVTAFRLFYAHGLRAAGIDTIIAESGVAKATFYKYFPAKDDLILAYLEQVDGVWTGQLHAAAEAASLEGTRDHRTHRS
ncbi:MULTISPECIES: TetR/AcrR family transcriptional regulator [unclassified Arthrobacter]